MSRIHDQDLTIFSPEERDAVQFYGSQIHEHATVHLNYTTYDIRCEQDTVNVSNEHCNIMMYSRGNNMHPYLYARVIGVFHAKVYYPGTIQGDRMDFLWVRWFECNTSLLSGWDAYTMDRISFVPRVPGDADDSAFSFVNPADVIRSCHLMPCWEKGRTKDYLGRSQFRHEDGDFRYYWVNRYLFHLSLMCCHLTHDITIEQVC